MKTDKNASNNIMMNFKHWIIQNVYAENNENSHFILVIGLFYLRSD